MLYRIKKNCFIHSFQIRYFSIKSSKKNSLVLLRSPKHYNIGKQKLHANTNINILKYKIYKKGCYNSLIADNNHLLFKVLYIYLPFFILKKIMSIRLKYKFFIKFNVN